LLETGELPNLARLRAEGASAVLESTIPFQPGPAWASYATGCSPAAHGVYDVTILREDDTLTVASGDDLRRTTYYEHLGAEGKRSVLINLPLDQDGCENTVIVNSWLTDDGARRILPIGRQARYERLLDAYRTFPEPSGGIDHLCELEQGRFDLARELFLAEDWDHFFVLFSSTNWAGHTLTGRFLQGDEDAAAGLIQLYRQLDRHVGWLVDHASGATIVVMSGHGQCEETAVLRVNSLLLELGLLTLQDRDSRAASRNEGEQGWQRRLRLPVAVSRHRANRFLRPPGLVAKRLMARGLGIQVVASVPRIDRTRSTAFMPTDAFFAVYLRSGDDGHPEHVRRALAELALPDGRPALDGVWTVEELYGRSPGPEDPALVFAPTAGVRPSAAVKEPVVDASAVPGRGCHQRDGIAIFAGAGVRPGELGRLSICDIAPTLLWSMGAGAPHRLDGRAVLEAFDPAFVADQPGEALLADEPDESFDSGYDGVARKLEGAL
jgi:predicted AlkP superfamily phosphohydrolase/phosphomutase